MKKNKASTRGKKLKKGTKIAATKALRIPGPGGRTYLNPQPLPP